MAITTIQRYIRHESFAGLLLMACALIALLLDNSPAHTAFNQLLHYTLGHESLRHWINHGLMTIFFLSVGLEIKRELIRGELNSWKKATLPCFAALGGMLVPIGCFFSLTYAHPLYWHGWAIPIATDIAFSLGIMTLLGKRCPLALKIFLMALATFDDLGAIGVIAIFYSAVKLGWLLLMAALCLSFLGLMNALNVVKLPFYLLGGVLLWWFIGQAGIDPAISGILIAFSIPLTCKPYSPASHCERLVHPWVAYGVLPLFALANAGVHFADINKSQLTSPLTLGILLGLLFGKPVGVFCFSWLAVKCRLATKPRTVTWPQIAGVACLCGVGFTMSLFIGELAFNDTAAHLSADYRLGILLSSISAGIIGFWWLKTAKPAIS